MAINHTLRDTLHSRNVTSNKYEEEHTYHRHI